jgi:hypothetical protein
LDQFLQVLVLYVVFAVVIGRVWLGFLLSLWGMYVRVVFMYQDGDWIIFFESVLCVVFAVVRVCLAWISSKSLGLVGVFNL